MLAVVLHPVLSFLPSSPFVALAANILLEPVNLNLTNKVSFAVMQSGTEVPERIGIVSPLHQA